MKITVRLYRQTDLDLIGLCCADGVSVSKELKKCLVAFVRGIPYSIKLKPLDVSAQIMTKKSVTLQFYLENKTHSDVINWLKTIRPRQRNSFLRNLLRSSLPCPYLYMYQTNQGLVSNMIMDIYDRQLEFEDEIEEPVVTPVATKPKINKPLTVVENNNHDIENNTVVEKPTVPTIVEPTPTPIVNKVPTVTNNHNYNQNNNNNNDDDSSNMTTNDNINYDYNPDEEDALFDALFNL